MIKDLFSLPLTLNIAMAVCEPSPCVCSPVSAFYKALLGNAAVSALRLHQRVPAREIALSREFVARFFLEDSAHYLFYSLIFMNVAPNLCILFENETLSASYVTQFETHTTHAQTY